jgi:internalin A
MTHTSPSAAQAETGYTIAERRIAELHARRSVLARLRDFVVGRSLDLSSLGLQSVPEGLRNVPPLDRLNLSGNAIRDLPDWFARISAMAINLDANRISRLPEELGWTETRTLSLKHNELEYLPESIHKAPNLQKLYLSGNSALKIPKGLLATATAQQILQYYAEFHDKNEEPLLELKIMLVGRGKAGKTALVKRLAGEIPEENEPETHSIAIREIPIMTSRGTVRARAWDLGGQDILHSTHQFFLTERSLYLLVLEPRSGLAQQDAEYWLRLIEAQGGGSATIVVMNWSHGRRWRVDEVRLKRKFPFIADAFIHTDAMSGEGIPTLRSAIVATMEDRMPDVWLPFPVHWRAIKNNVAGMRASFMTFQAFARLCANYDVTDADKQAEIAGVLHALGLALYFGKDKRLHDTRVLNPGWVTGGVYAVIRSPSVAANDGQLSVQDMTRVLREAEEQNVVKAADYPHETHPFILELMRAFQLCYASEEAQETGKPTRYLVPELLPPFEPGMPEHWEAAPIRLRYRYDVLPRGLLPRFIVRTHTLSEGAPHWRQGVVLRHGEASALIRDESDRPELHVFVLGGDEDTRRVLVTMVRRELEALHGEMKMAPVEDLELTGAGEHWIGVRALREFEEPQHSIIRLPIQPEGTADVDVPRELDKLEPPESRAIDRDRAAALVPVRVFVSYAHGDERQLQRLDMILGVLEFHHGLVPWRDKRLIAGDGWDGEIRRRLEDMDIFLFIASQRSLVSRYIRDLELKRAQERHAAGEVEIVSVALERCAVDDDPVVGKLQRLAPEYDSIADASPRSTGWEQVRKDLLPVIKRVRARKEGEGDIPPA